MDWLLYPLFIIKYGPQSDPHTIAISPVGIIIFTAIILAVLLRSKQIQPIFGFLKSTIGLLK